MTIRHLAAMPTAALPIRPPVRPMPVRAAARELARALAHAVSEGWVAWRSRRRAAIQARALCALDARTLRDLGIEPDGAGRAARGGPDPRGTVPRW